MKRGVINRTPIDRAAVSTLALRHPDFYHIAAGPSKSIVRPEINMVDPSVLSSGAFGTDPGFRPIDSRSIRAEVSVPRAIERLILKNPGDGQGDGVSIRVGNPFDFDGVKIVVGGPKRSRIWLRAGTNRDGVTFFEAHVQGNITCIRGPRRKFRLKQFLRLRQTHF